MAMIYLIRHGQASFLKEDYDKLSELGITQSKILGESLNSRSTRPDSAIGGSLVRHHETAAHCLESMGLSLGYKQADHWNEYDHMELLTQHNPTFTDYEAIGEHLRAQQNPMAALQHILNDSIRDWMQEKHEYKVSWKQFKDQVWGGLDEVAEHLGKGQSTFVFTSGGPIAVVMMKLLDLKEEQFVELQGRLVNSSLTKVLVGKGKLSLSTYNDYSHLEHNSDLITYR
jgi:broad specificity phosphatase PhoE